MLFLESASGMTRPPSKEVTGDRLQEEPQNGSLCKLSFGVGVTLRRKVSGTRGKGRVVRTVVVVQKTTTLLGVQSVGETKKRDEKRKKRVRCD